MFAFTVAKKERRSSSPVLQCVEDLEDDLNDSGDHKPFPEGCSLPFDEQTKNLKAAYSDAAFEKHPLLPPYTLEEVCAMEVKYSFSFPPLLRFYILNISRETSFTNYRTLIQPMMCCGNQDVRRPDKWSCHIATHGDRFGVYDRIIWFSGDLRGFVQSRSNIRTLYEQMMMPDLCCSRQVSFHLVNRGCSAVFPTLEETLEKCRCLDPGSSNCLPLTRCMKRVRPEIKDVELPEELKQCRRESMEAIGIILGHTRIRRMVEDLNGKARVIQRQYRLWRWRKDVLWNPHTDIGRLNLLVRARLSHVVSD